MDFLIISQRPTRSGVVEVYPHFDTRKSRDLMVKGGDFYAIWNEEEGLWSTDQDTVINLIDKALDEYKAKNPLPGNVYITKYMRDSDSGSIDKWKKYVKQQLPTNRFHQLNQKVIFANSPVNKKDYQKSPYMEHYIEGNTVSGVDFKYILKDRQVSGTGYREKFCQPLDDSQEYGL